MYTRCAYHNCQNKSQDNISMFRFPVHDLNRLSVWIRNSGNPSLKSLTKVQLRCRYLCTEHFLPSTICRGTLRSRLIGPALPIHFQSAKVGEGILIMTKNDDADMENDPPVTLPEVFNVKPPIKCYSKKPRTFTTENHKSTSSSFKRPLVITPTQRLDNSGKLMFEGPKRIKARLEHIFFMKKTKHSQRIVEDDDMKYCKICLVSDCKMFSSPSINKLYSQLVQELCDYELYVCYECKHLLIKYQEFRSKSMMALTLLSSIQIDHSKVTKRLIKEIDRKHHKLESKLSHYNSYEEIVLPEPSLDIDIKTEMVICNGNEQIVLPEPSLDSDIKTENDNNPNALEDDRSEINNDVDAGGVLFAVETRDTEYTNEFLIPEHNLESDIQFRTDTNPDAFENDNSEINFEFYSGGLFSDVETQGTNKEHPHEIFDLNHAPNNTVTETKLKHKCKPNSKKTKEIVPIKIKTLKSIKKKLNLNKPLGYLSKRPSNYMMQLIKHYVTIDEQKCLPSSKKTKESVPKKIETLKRIEKKGNPDNPLSYLNKKPSDYMMQMIQNYTTIDVMTPSEAKKELLLKKETDNYKNNLHKCDLCWKGFVYETTYKNHMKLHSPDLGTEDCEFCHRLFRKKSELLRHIEECHKYKITCKCCPFVCFSLKQAKSHVGVHKGKTYTCEQCEMSFRYSHTLVNHKRIKHSELVCAHCGSMFASPMGLRSHKHRAHKQDSTEMLGPKCEECDVQFATETAWKRHLVLSSKHTVINGCKECGETFHTADELRCHAKEHPRRLAKTQYYKLRTRKAVRKPRKKRLETDSEYKEHKKSAKPNTEAANQIVKRPVEEDMRFICEVCGKAFRSCSFLNYHVNTHTGERPYGCEQCGKKYTNPSSLFAHTVVHHSGAPKFTCDICQKRFHTKGPMRTHIMLVHLGVRSFKCDICNKLFRYRYEVRMHKEYVHFKKPWPKRDRTTKRRNKDKDTVE